MDLKNINMTLIKTSKKKDIITRQCADRKKTLEKTTNSLQKSRNCLKTLLNDQLLSKYRINKENLLREVAYMKKIEELEDHRAKLEDGKACPLCGSTEHPFAEKNIPKLNDIEQKIESLTNMITKAEYQEAAIKTLEQVETTARKKLNDSEKLESNAANDKKAAEKTLAELKDTLTKLQAGFKELNLAVLVKLQPLGITEIPESDESLKLRLNTWQEQVKNKTNIEKQIANIDNEMKNLSTVIKMQTSTLTDHKKQLKSLKKDKMTKIDERKKLYGDKNLDDEEHRLNENVSTTEKAEEKAKKVNAEYQQALTTAKTRVESLKERISNKELKRKKTDDLFSSSLKSKGFDDEKQFLEAKMTTKEQEILSTEAKDLDDAQTKLKAKQEDRAKRLDNEIFKNMTDQPPDLLKTQFEEYEESLNKLHSDILTLEYALKENRAATEQIKEEKGLIDDQKKELHRWEKLHGLIGSADGKKYRNFAQGLTFELIVSHANCQLQKMTDRYLLIRDNKQPLELNAVDHYQNGEIRSIKNLSGGESFIVSLALALGLSQMASRKIRVDSLFLDEGFGTLDEDTLEIALETLSGLQQDGKLIGIVSHISALKERIHTQITIIPISGGRSLLAGLGCRKVIKNSS